MLEQVRRTIQRHRMLVSGERVGVAVSGGADSVCLLHVLHNLSVELGVTLLVLHLNHMLRGAEADSDAEFVRGLASALGLPCRIDSEDVGSRGGNLEEAGRDARWSFFHRVRESGEITHVATGHTRSDQAETVLYRLLRGSGTAGLSGIRPVTRDGLIRPLIDCSRQEVESYLAAVGLSWREDHTNAETTFVRNRLRHRVLPFLMSEISLAVPDVLAGTATLAADEEDYWSAELERLAPRLITQKLAAVLLRADELSRLHPAFARRLLRLAVGQVKGNMRSIDFIHIERIRELAGKTDGHGRVQIPGLDIFRSFEWLRIGPLPQGTRFDRDYAFPVEVSVPGDFVRVPVPNNAAIYLEIRDLATKSTVGAYNGSVYELDWESLPGKLELRNWHPGDELALPGRSCQKIKTLFQEHRVPIWERQTWPVLTSGSDIVWSRAFGVADLYRLRTESRFVLRVYESEGAGGLNLPAERPRAE